MSSTRNISTLLSWFLNWEMGVSEADIFVRVAKNVFELRKKHFLVSKQQNVISPTYASHATKLETLVSGKMFPYDVSYFLVKTCL